MEENKIIDVEEIKEDKSPTLELGNYIIEIKTKDEVIKKIAVANAEINIIKLADGGLTIDLK